MSALSSRALRLPIVQIADHRHRVISQIIQRGALPQCEINDVCRKWARGTPRCVTLCCTPRRIGRKTSANLSNRFPYRPISVNLTVTRNVGMANAF